MSNHINQRIAYLRELIQAGFHQANLDKMVAECNVLAQDTSHVLPFFVLKKVFAEMSVALEGEAVAIDQFRDLTAGVAEPSILILDKIAKNERIEATDLESVVRAHIRNVNVFRSDR